MSPRKAKASAWWAEPGPETCEFCSQTYRVEVGYYCADCDRGICPVCVVTVVERSSVHCPQCPDDAEPGSG